MKRSAIRPGKGFKPRTEPMARGNSTLKSRQPLRPGGKLRARKPASLKPKRTARNAGPVDYLALCRGHVGCFLLVPGHPHDGREATEPSHSNQIRDGKGMGMKALDVYTVPACRACHHEIDHGHRFTRAEKFALWDAAYARWEPVRAAMIAALPHHVDIILSDIK